MLYLGGEDMCNKDILTGAQLYNRQVETNHTRMLYFGGEDKCDKEVLTGA